MAGYPQQLIYFMWQWQVHYMISSKVRAESLFGEIDKKLLATAFLLGFSDEVDDNHQLVCFEPEKMEFLKKDFDNIDEVAEKFAGIDPKKNIYYTGGMQGQMDERRKQKNFREAIKDILDNSASFTDKIHFIAPGIQKNGYKVYVVLQLKKSIYSSYVFLKYKDPEEFLDRDHSFIDAVINVYLEDCAWRLYFPEAGRDRGPERSYDELLRAGAQHFMYTVALAGRSNGFHAIYPACQAVSLLPYEHRDNNGHLIVCASNHRALKLTLKLKESFDITDYRKLRKLLELTDEKTGVVTNSQQVLGLGHIKKSYDASKEDVFHVFFRGQHCYDVFHQDQAILVMRHGRPEQIGQVISASKFADDARIIFNEIREEQIDALYKLSNSVALSGKGCMLVFIPDAKEEAERLGNQSITIKPKKMDEETVKVLTGIDGAVIIDLNAYAHAKGVILDGVAGLEGDSSRGSRYNSALTYSEYRGWKKPSMIVVVSDDGMVDVIPNLMPAIRHSEIIQFINTLESLNSAENFNSQTYYNMMDLLASRAFYLTPKECDQVNALNKSLSELDHKIGKNSWRVFSEFEPNPRMNDRFYIQELKN